VHQNGYLEPTFDVYC